MVYIGHWIIFGFVYLAFAVANNDYDKIMGIIDPNSNQTMSDNSLEPCVSDVYDMTSAFLFSMESETTIGECTYLLQTCNMQFLLMLAFGQKSFRFV